MVDVRIMDEMVGWLKEWIEHCGNVTMSEFAETFKYSCREDADRTFLALICKSFLHKAARHTLQSSYEVWKRNESDQFWAAMEAMTQVATDLVVGSVPKARKIVLGDNHLSCTKLNMQVVPMASASSIPNAYQVSAHAPARKGES